MLEVEVIVTRGELEEPILVAEVTVTVRVHVRERAANEDVRITDVRRSDRETQQRVRAWGDVAFLNAAKASRKVFDTHKPVVARGLFVDNQVGKPHEIGDAA